jgi:hypothetical protein
MPVETWQQLSQCDRGIVVFPLFVEWVATPISDEMNSVLRSISLQSQILCGDKFLDLRTGKYSNSEQTVDIASHWSASSSTLGSEVLNLSFGDLGL